MYQANTDSSSEYLSPSEEHHLRNLEQMNINLELCYSDLEEDAIEIPYS
jgi:hypothetical protein